MNYTPLISLLLVGMLLGCNGEPEDKGPRFAQTPLLGDGPVYTLTVHPLHNPAKLVQAFQPVVDYFSLPQKQQGDTHADH